MSEASYMRRVQIAAAKRGINLYRNNVGVFWQGIKCKRMPDGKPVPQGYVLLKKPRMVRCGLTTHSSDLIGWTPMVITTAHVGQTVAVFTSVETKSRRGTVQPEQTNWLAAVERDGGIARVMREGVDEP